MSLNNLSIRLADAGRPGGRAGRRSTRPSSIYRRLAEANPAAFLPDLAMSLNNLSIRLPRPGDRGGALAAIEEAVEHLPAAGRGQPRRVPARPRHVAEQPVQPAVRRR